MLTNLPKPGTQVRFTRTVQYRQMRFAAGALGQLVRPLGQYVVDLPTDRFVVNINGQDIEVMRADIEEVR